MKKILLSLFVFTLTLFAQAQDSLAVNTEREASGLRAEGKIYVVMVVSVTILIGLFIYLIRLDRKITKIERQSPDGRRQ
jgi:hypothetical protein